MHSSFHKKIQRILKEANLPKNLSDELKKELESHFYEKELSLQFKGLKPDEIQSQIEKDFGDDEMIGVTFQFVHKKSFYSFIKYLMKHFSIITASVFQFIFGALLIKIIFLDSNADFLEILVYYLLAFIPFVVSILVMYKKKDYKTAFLAGGILYILSALILRYLNIIDAKLNMIPTFYVTGSNGVSFQMAFFAMAIHTIILLFVLTSIQRKSKKEKAQNS